MAARCRRPQTQRLQRRRSRRVTAAHEGRKGISGAGGRHAVLHVGDSPLIVATRLGDGWAGPISAHGRARPYHVDRIFLPFFIFKLGKLDGYFEPAKQRQVAEPRPSEGKRRCGGSKQTMNQVASTVAIDGMGDASWRDDDGVGTRPQRDTREARVARRDRRTDQGTR